MRQAYILSSLSGGIVGILLVIVVLLTLATLMPLFLQALLESGLVSESIRQTSRSLMMGMGGLGSAIFGLIIALLVVLMLVGKNALKTFQSQR